MSFSKPIIIIVKEVLSITKGLDHKEDLYDLHVKCGVIEGVYRFRRRDFRINKRSSKGIVDGDSIILIQTHKDAFFSFVKLDELLYNEDFFNKKGYYVDRYHIGYDYNDTYITLNKNKTIFYG